MARRSDAPSERVQHHEPRSELGNDVEEDPEILVGGDVRSPCEVGETGRDSPLSVERPGELSFGHHIGSLGDDVEHRGRLEFVMVEGSTHQGPHRPPM